MSWSRESVFVGDYFVFADMESRDALWQQICFRLDAPTELRVIHFRNKGKYFEHGIDEKLSLNASCLVRGEHDGEPLILVQYCPGNGSPDFILEMLRRCPQAKLIHQWS